VVSEREWWFAVADAWCFRSRDQRACRGPRARRSARPGPVRTSSVGSRGWSGRPVVCSRPGVACRAMLRPTAAGGCQHCGRASPALTRSPGRANRRGSVELVDRFGGEGKGPGGRAGSFDVGALRSRREPAVGTVRTQNLSRFRGAAPSTLWPRVHPPAESGGLVCGRERSRPGMTHQHRCGNLRRELSLGSCR
jgi:hypothetical protein